MSETSSNRWEGTKTLLTFLSLVVSGVALWQSHLTSNKQTELAEQSMAIQNNTYQRQKAMVDIANIRVWLQHGEGVEDLVYPREEADEFERIPRKAWDARMDHYAVFNIDNPGNQTIYIESVGLGATEDGWRTQDFDSTWCQNKDDPALWEGCPREIAPARSVRYNLYLNDTVLRDLSDDWQSKGLEICVKIEAYNLYCERSNAVALPEGMGSG